LSNDSWRFGREDSARRTHADDDESVFSVAMAHSLRRMEHA
jgi:hypothetical protein